MRCLSCKLEERALVAFRYPEFFLSSQVRFTECPGFSCIASVTVVIEVLLDKPKKESSASETDVDQISSFEVC